jgi:hypothetical protein
MTNNQHNGILWPFLCMRYKSSATQKKIAMKRRLCMNGIVDVRGMNVNMRVSEDPIEGILRCRELFPTLN